jgi:hypothetical protein
MVNPIRGAHTPSKPPGLQMQRNKLAVAVRADENLPANDGG